MSRGRVRTRTRAPVTSAQEPATEVPALLVAPVIDTSAGNSVGDAWTVSTGSWSNGPIISYEYRVTRDATPVGGETTNGYTLAQPDDPGTEIGWEVRAENAIGFSDWEIADGALTVRPYYTVAASVSGTYAVGQTLTATPGTVIGEDGQGGEWYVDDTGTMDTDTSYTIQVADAGALVEYVDTSTNAGGDTVSSDGGTVVPYWSVAPSFTGTALEGQTLTGVAGTVAGETSGPTYSWYRDDVSLSEPTTHLCVFADAGAELVYRGTASNAGGASEAESVDAEVAALPVNTAPASIAGGNWPGGTMTATPGTWDYEDSVGGEWRLGGSGTGDTDTTYLPLVGGVGSALLYRETAQPGSVVQDSNSTTIVRSSGVDRPSQAGPYPECQGLTIGAAVTVVTECVLDSVPTSGGGWICALLVQTSPSDRTGIGIRANHDGTPANDTVDVLLYDGVAGPVVTTSTVAAPGISSGTAYVVCAETTGVAGTLRVRLGPRGGSATGTTIAIPGGNSPAGTLNLSLFRQTSGWTATARNTAGAVSAVVIGSAIGATAMDALIALPRGAVQSLYGSDIGRVDAAADEAVGATVTTAADLDCTGGTAVLQSGTGSLTIGGLNVAV